MLRAVIDTNVLFVGLTHSGPCGQIVGAWLEERFIPCVSTALALEYEEVLRDKLGDRKRRLALAALPALLHRAEHVPIMLRIRPISNDPDDDMVIECAFCANASIVTMNRRDFVQAHDVLGIDVLSPEEFLDDMEV